jgi:ArsR family transcriptional regulator, arsenate/arsenite/antimonite-responsive transcriptional repressor
LKCGEAAAQMPSACAFTLRYPYFYGYFLTGEIEKYSIYLEYNLNRWMVNMGFQETFKALSDPVRREILVLLKSGKMTAGEIVSHFDMTGATISYHLSVLKKADLVYESKYKNYIYYQLNTSVFEEIMLWLTQFGGQGNNED